MSTQLRAYVMDVSYFSGKLEAYLRYKEIPYERIEVGWGALTGRVKRNSGLARVPVLETGDGEWLQDSTPIIDWVEARWPAGRVIPEDPHQAFLSRLLEDYADEWLWRPALHYRWSPAPDARLLSERIAREVMFDRPGPVALKAWLVRQRQRAVYVRGDAVTPATREHVEGVYRGCLVRLEAILAGRRFLLGDRPSLADFGFFASMFRHFSLDPTPARIMRDEAPGVFAWVARLWNARHSRESGPWEPPGQVPTGWQPLLRDAGETHLQALHANAVAWRAGRRRFDLEVQGVRYRNLPVVPYRVWCRERLQQHFEQVPEAVRPALRERLEACGAWEPLWRDGPIASGVPWQAEPALRRPRPPGRWQRLRALLPESPWRTDGAR